MAVLIERQRRRTLAGLWFFLVLGLSYTTTGVQEFLAGDRPREDPVWWAAWAVEPMFAGLLIVLLNFEAVILSHGIDPDHPWWTRLKHVLLLSTLFMNVYPPLALLAADRERFSLGDLVVHAIIPVIVYGLAEVIPVIQAKARQVVLDAYAAADEVEQQTAAEPAESAHPDCAEPAQPDPAETARPAPAEPEQPDAGSAPPRADAPVERKPAVRLPPPLMAKLSKTRTELAAKGREMTRADVQQVVQLPDDQAQLVLDDMRQAA
ncbi:hypothetical protein [Saccharopolyspora erythraea]|uniref:hypothetical protein n=1 Tax=Saccharopolyspora erythraea TaxID=1836 RepID=UPI00201260A0|nr:hypothetical protein [Saccharopolyspora erythraea]